MRRSYVVGWWKTKKGGGLKAQRRPGPKIWLGYLGLGSFLPNTITAAQLRCNHTLSYLGMHM